MGALACLLREAGHRVTGSDTAFHPPVAPALALAGVETKPGWDPANLEPAPDLVVVGNVCRKDNPEARSAIERGLRYASFPAVLEALFLKDRPSFVVAGTHGKTTTASLLAYLLFRVGRDPGMLIGGLPGNFDASARLGGARAPFVVEGDEYDSAFFEKTPKFWRYRPWAVAITSVEHDHVDIYPTAEAYRAAFAELVRRIPDDGLLVGWAGDPTVRELAAGARCRVRLYAVDGDDCGGESPVWLAALGPTTGGTTAFDVFGAGTFCGRGVLPGAGRHNVRNALAALALASEGVGAPVGHLLDVLGGFKGVRRRQELIGVADGVRVYDDFAHHPTAVAETLRGLRALHPHGKLIAAFEPRSATASRATHQAQYAGAFRAADHVLVAPVGRPEIRADERLDVHALADAIVAAGGRAEAPASVDALVARIAELADPGDTVVLMSNGTFGGAHAAALEALAARPPRPPSR